MKFAIKYFGKSLKNINLKNWHIVVIFVAVVGLLIGIPFMFIGGFKVIDLLIPVIASAGAALLAIIFPYVLTIIACLKYYKCYAVFNRKGYCPELLERVKKINIDRVGNKIFYKLHLISICRNTGQTDEALKLLMELGAEELGQYKPAFVFHYLALALQLENLELFDTKISENTDMLAFETEEDKLGTNGGISHLCICAECMKGNYKKAQEMCEYHFENKIWLGVCFNILYTYVLTKLGETELAEASAVKAREFIDNMDSDFEFEKPAFRRKVEKALKGELTIPYTQV